MRRRARIYVIKNAGPWGLVVLRPRKAPPSPPRAARRIYGVDSTNGSPADRLLANQREITSWFRVDENAAFAEVFGRDFADGFFINLQSRDISGLFVAEYGVNSIGTSIMTLNPHTMQHEARNVSISLSVFPLGYSVSRTHLSYLSGTAGAGYLSRLCAESVDRLVVSEIYGDVEHVETQSAGDASPAGFLRTLWGMGHNRTGWAICHPSRQTEILRYVNTRPSEWGSGHGGLRKIGNIEGMLDVYSSDIVAADEVLFCDAPMGTRGTFAIQGFKWMSCNLGSDTRSLCAMMFGKVSCPETYKIVKYE